MHTVFRDSPNIFIFKKESCKVYPYSYYPDYPPLHPEAYVPYEYPYIEQPDTYDVERQPPQFQDFERRLRQLERQNDQQTRELTRQNQEINRITREIQRINQEITRLNQNDQRHTRRLNRLNQRLREVENRLRIPFTPLEDGF